MKMLRLFPALLVFATSALAVDTTPPTLTITRTWIEKAGTRSNFNMLLDPQDETGLEVMDPLGTPGATGTIWFRSELINDPVPDTKAWKMMPWTRGQPFSLGFTCTKCVIEIRAKDAAGNFSPIQRRFFTAPFPYTSAPVTSIKLRDSTSTNFPGPALDCRGLFAGEVDGVGLSGDIIQVDRTSGEVMVRRQTGYLFTNSNVLSLPANSIEDSAAADYDKDGRLDLVLVVNGALRLYHNDGLVSDVLTFTEVTIAPVALNGLGMTTINNACFGDLSGEGKPEIFVSGTDSGGAARVGWLHHNAVNVFGSANNILAPTGASAGKVAVGDVTGDGRLDLVMIDAAVMQVILFKNDDNARLVGDDDVDTAKRPASTAISDGRPDIRAKSLAVGDVTGDGRADAVVIMSWWGSSNPLDRDDNHNFQYWQLLDSLGDTGLRAQPMQKVSASPFSATEEIFASDVIIEDLNGDRFPEVIMTSQFEADIADDPDTTVARGPGVRALQFFPHLDSQNRLSQLDYQTVVRVRIVSLSNPHRLVTAPYSGSKLADIWVACNSANTPFGWVSNSSGSGTTAALAVLGGASTQNDPNGSDGPNGTVTYFVYPGNSVDYQLTYINNTTSTLTNATMDCVLPNNVTVETQDGASLITAKTTQTLRWTLATIGAGETGTKNFRVRVLVTSKTGLLRPKNLIKAGTKTASSYMPNVTIDEPIDFDLVGVETTSDPFDPMHPGATTGQFVHFAEFITYKMKVTNRGTLTITDTKISMDMPKNTLFSGPVSNYPAGTIYLLNSGSKHLDIIVDSLASNEEKEVFVNVEVRAESGSIINNTLTALRPSGTSRKLPPIVTPVLPPLGITLEANRDTASPGENIEYTLRAKNWSTDTYTAARVVCQIPAGTKLVSAHGKQSASQNWTDSDSPRPAFALKEDTAPAYFFKTPESLLTWDLGDIAGGKEIVMQFIAMVGSDAPTNFFTSGQPTPIQLAGDSYNLMATPPTGGRMLSFVPTDAKDLADFFNLLPKTPLPPVLTSVDSINPQPEPNLALTKSALSPRDPLGVDPYDSDPATEMYPPLARLPDGTYTVQKSSYLTYALHVANYGNGPAINAMVHDVIPLGMTFTGFIAKDRRLVQSLSFSRCYDAKGKLIPAAGQAFTDMTGALHPDYGEVFFDNNHNGKWEAPETFTDANGNKKYDGVASIRSFDLYAGTLAIGETHRFFYQVQCTAALNAVITSTYGGTGGQTDGLNFSLKPGYYMLAENLYFPVDGGPHEVKVKVVNPALGTLPLPRGVEGNAELANSASAPPPAPANKSVGTLAPPPSGDFITVTMPFDVRGTGPVTNVQMFMDIPAGYVVLDAVVKDKTGPNLVTYLPPPNTGAQKLTNITSSKTGGVGPCTVTFPMGTLRFGWPVLKLGFDPAVLAKPLPNLLLNPQGQTRDPLIIKVKLTGTGLVSTSSQIQVDARANTTNDAKVFVGRAARMSAQRNDLITYTIFVGNLSNKLLDLGTIEMKVPTGCDFDSITNYKGNNHISQSPYEYSGTELSGNYIARSRQAFWDIGLIAPAEVGSVSLTVKVRQDFTGDRIDDNSCVFTVRNACNRSPGPISVAIRTGDAKTQAGEITERCLQGVQVRHNDAVVTMLKQNLQVDESSMSVTVGGADILQLNNGVSVIPLAHNRVVLIGTPSGIQSNTTTFRRILSDSPSLRIAVGPGGPTGLRLIDVPTYNSGYVVPNDMLRALATPSANVLAQGGGNIIVGNGLNLIKAGGSDFIPNPALVISPSQILLPASEDEIPIPTPPIPITTAVADGTIRLVGPTSRGVVAAGNGSAALGLPANPPLSALLATPGSSGLIGNDGASLLGNDGASLLGNDGASLVGQDAAGVVSNDGAGVVSNDGAGVVSNDGAGVVSNDGAGIVAGGGGNIFSVTSGIKPP